MDDSGSDDGDDETWGEGTILFVTPSALCKWNKCEWPCDARTSEARFHPLSVVIRGAIRGTC